MNDVLGEVAFGAEVIVAFAACMHATVITHPFPALAHLMEHLLQGIFDLPDLLGE